MPFSTADSEEFLKTYFIQPVSKYHFFFPLEVGKRKFTYVINIILFSSCWDIWMAQERKIKKKNEKMLQISEQFTSKD